MPKPVSHVIRRPGRWHGDPDIEIPVAEDLVSEPGSPVREKDLSFFSRTQPLESQNLEKGADREWAWLVYTPEVAEYRKGHDERMVPHIELAAESGDLEPTGELPHFEREFFEFPHGRKEDWLFQQLKDRLDEHGVPPAEDLTEFAGKVKDVMERQRHARGDE